MPSTPSHACPDCGDWHKGECAEPKEVLEGTRWVEIGEGSSWDELRKAFGPLYFADMDGGPEKTNLLLTGDPLTPEDRERWESDCVTSLDNCDAESLKEKCHICHGPADSFCDSCNRPTCQYHMAKVRAFGLEGEACAECRGRRS